MCFGLAKGQNQGPIWCKSIQNEQIYKSKHTWYSRYNFFISIFIKFILNSELTWELEC